MLKNVTKTVVKKTVNEAVLCAMSIGNIQFDILQESLVVNVDLP